MLETAAPETDDQPDALAGPARNLLPGQLSRLDRLAEDAEQVALAIGARLRAIAADDQAPLAEVAAALDRTSRAYGRVARAARLAEMLRAKLAVDIEAAERAAARDASPAAPPEPQRIVIERTLVDPVNRRRDLAERAIDRLVADSDGGVDREDFTADLLARPVSELITLVCKELGIDPDQPPPACLPPVRDQVSDAVGGWLWALMPPSPDRRNPEGAPPPRPPDWPDG